MDPHLLGLPRFFTNTAQEEALKRYLAVLREKNEILWRCYLKRKWGRLRFNTWVHKHSTVDSFISSLHRPSRHVGKRR